MPTPIDLYADIISRMNAGLLMDHYQENIRTGGAGSLNHIMISYVLRMASESGSLETVRILLGVGIVFTPAELNDALCAASLFGHKSVVQRLLQKLEQDTLSVTALAVNHAITGEEKLSNPEGGSIVKMVMRSHMTAP
jgi:hypothetical protein